YTTLFRSRAARLVHLRLGQSGVHHLGRDRTHRPLPVRSGLRCRRSLRDLPGTGAAHPPLGGGLDRRAPQRAASDPDHGRGPAPCTPVAAGGGTGRPEPPQEAVAVLAGRGRVGEHQLDVLTDDYRLTALLFVLGNVGYGLSIVVFHAFLPEIATEEERNRVSVT